MSNHLISLIEKQISHLEEQLQTWNEIKRIVENERQNHRKDSETSPTVAG